MSSDRDWRKWGKSEPYLGVVAFLKALATSRQALASWYPYLFQLPRIPERVLLGTRGTQTVLSKVQSWANSQPRPPSVTPRRLPHPEHSPLLSTGTARSPATMLGLVAMGPVLTTA